MDKSVKYLLHLIMRNKLLIAIAAVMICLSVRTTEVMASGFNIDSIGNVETSGQQISHWWYTGTNVVIKGTAVAGATVNTNVDGVTSSVTVDDSGSWTFSPGDLGEGDKVMVFDSNGSEIKFTLTLGTDKVDWNAVGSSSSSALPATGTDWPTLFLIIGGIGALGLGGKMVFNVNRE